MYCIFFLIELLYRRSNEYGVFIKPNEENASVRLVSLKLLPLNVSCGD